jgi:hypothetical protein
MQSRPLHRADVRLSSDECNALGLRTGRLAWIIPTDAALVPIRSRAVLGQASESLLTRIAITIRRSRNADRLERRHMP